MAAAAAAWQGAGLEVAAARRWRRQRQSGNGSTVAAVASLKAKVAAWWKCDFGGSCRALGCAMAVRWWRQQHGISSSSMVLEEVAAAGAARWAVRQQWGRRGMC